ncbi:30S ribosomal protein S13 [Candidatus Micrarchaeota archaeon]|nr:30S ribosomal protein S13 [Candidatus Micrarchaeota archaeon]
MAKKGKAPKKEKKPKKEEKEKTAAPKKRKEVREGLRGIVRIAGKDVTGETPLLKALMKVKGISHSVSNAINGVVIQKLNLNVNILAGELTDEQIGKIDDILLNIQKYVPAYLLNRRTDPTTGENRHVITNDLIFAVRQDVEKEKKLYTWKGFRHAYGQKVRGQRTKNTGRGGAAMGVVRKAQQPQKGGSEKKEAKK